MLRTTLPRVEGEPAKCEKKEFAETQAKYQQCAAAKIASISKALEVSGKCFGSSYRAT